jgi:hypothetical protein
VAAAFTGEQYKGMVEAVDTVINQNNWDMEARVKTWRLLLETHGQRATDKE